MQTLRHVLWIGGPAGAGKTTIATRLARRYGLRWYNADTRTWVHRDRAIAAGNLAAIRWEAMTQEERRVKTSPAEKLELTLHYDRGQMVIDDLRRLPASPLIVAEGTTLAPSVVSSGVADRSRALWLLPTREFSRARIEERAWPPEAVDFYAWLVETIESDVAHHDAPFLAVNESRGVDEMVEAVEEVFAAALAAGPCVTTLDGRRALLREANEAIQAQVRGYYARPWADGDAEAVDRDFVCECGDTACCAFVRVAVGAASTPVLAPGHR